MDKHAKELVELRDRVHQLETAVHLLIEAVQMFSTPAVREKATEAFERMPL